MAKTKRQIVRKGSTKKHLKQILDLCPIGLKPFEENFSKTLPSGHLKKSSELQKKQFVKQLLSKFAPHSLKPENPCYIIYFSLFRHFNIFFVIINQFERRCLTSSRT